jgi:hypothetical protein
MKRKKYKGFCKAIDMVFTPFVLESIGGMGKDCSQLLHASADSQSQLDTIVSSTALSRLRTKICFRWQRELGSALQTKGRCTK